MKKKKSEPILSKGIEISSKEIKDVGHNRVICKIEYFYKDDSYFDGYHHITGVSVCNVLDTFIFSVGSRIATLKAYKKANNRYYRCLLRHHTKASNDIYECCNAEEFVETLLMKY